MDENVAKAVDEVDLRFTSGNAVPVERASVRDHEWQTIRARLVELEAENERLRADRDSQQRIAIAAMERAEMHGALLFDLFGCAQSAIKAGDWKVDGACDPEAILSRITAHLSENGHG